MNKVVSRRGGGLQQTILTKDVAHAKTTSKSLPTPSPRSGQFLLPVFYERTHRDESKQRKYQVHLPTRMLWILAMVFLLVPLSIFGYREAHFHETQEHAPHFKTEKFVNVNTEAVLAQLSKRSIHNDKAEDVEEESLKKPSSDDSQDAALRAGAVQNPFEEEVEPENEDLLEQKNDKEEEVDGEASSDGDVEDAEATEEGDNVLEVDPVDLLEIAEDDGEDEATAAEIDEALEPRR